MEVVPSKKDKKADSGWYNTRKHPAATARSSFEKPFNETEQTSIKVARAQTLEKTRNDIFVSEASSFETSLFLDVEKGGTIVIFTECKI